MEYNEMNLMTSNKESQEEHLLISASMIPQRVEEQVAKLANLDAKVQQALKSAEDSRERVNQAQNTRPGFLGIASSNSLQTVSDAVGALAKANENNAKALAEVFGFSQSLAEITEGLFALSAMSMAANNMVLQQLELKLKGASKTKLSELAKSELKRTISMLKNQGAIYKQQAEMKELQKNMLVRLDALANESDEQLRENDEQNNRIKAGEEKDAEQDALLEQHSHTDQEHALLIQENKEVNQRQDQLIAENIEQDARQDQLIAENAEQNARQDELIAQHTEKDVEHDKQLMELRAENKDLRAEISALRERVEKKSSRTLSLIALTIAIVSLIAVGIQFFI